MTKQVCSTQSYHHTNTTLFYYLVCSSQHVYQQSSVQSFVLIIFCGLDFMVHSEEITDKSGTKYSRESIQINLVHMHIHSPIHNTFIYTYKLTYPHTPPRDRHIFFNKSKITNFFIRFWTNIISNIKVNLILCCVKFRM